MAGVGAAGYSLPSVIVVLLQVSIAWVFDLEVEAVHKAPSRRQAWFPSMNQVGEAPHILLRWPFRFGFGEITQSLANYQA